VPAGDDLRRSVVDVPHHFAESRVEHPDGVGTGVISEAVCHHVYDVQIGPVDDALPEVVTPRPVGCRQPVRLDVQEVGVPQVDPVWDLGAVVVPVPMPVVVAVRLVEQAHEGRAFP